MARLTLLSHNILYRTSVDYEYQIRTLFAQISRLLTIISSFSGLTKYNDALVAMLIEVLSEYPEAKLYRYVVCP